MDAVLRALAVYTIVVLVFRLAGKRTLDAVTLFDFVLLLIIAEATQQALLGDDLSITNAALVVTTLVLTDKGLAVAANRFEWIDRRLNNVPLILIEDGLIHGQRIRRSNLSLDDVLQSARQGHGIERMAQIKYAVLERDGTVSIVPRQAGTS
jgi:uncharacterized membrane protein YcaP (DUF421 family)